MIRRIYYWIINYIKHYDYEKELLPQIMNTLYHRGLQSILVEGGTQLLQSFIDNNLWDEAFIEEAKVTEAVKNAISLEMDMAEKMKAYLQTEKMQQLLQKETQQYSEKAWMIFQEMEQVEKDRIPLYEKFRDYEIGQTEYQEKKEEIQAQLQMYENDFEGLMDRLANMKKAYSEENEWIKTFQREELPEKLESQHVKKWVDKIIVSDLRDEHEYLTMQNWKNYFPEEWMEE